MRTVWKAQATGRVGRLVLCTPPSWENLRNELPRSEVSRNLAVLQALPRVVFRALASRRAIKFFSDLFLFSSNANANVNADADSGIARTRRRQRRGVAGPGHGRRHRLREPARDMGVQRRLLRSQELRGAAVGARPGAHPRRHGLRGAAAAAAARRGGRYCYYCCCCCCCCYRASEQRERRQ